MNNNDDDPKKQPPMRFGKGSKALFELLDNLNDLGLTFKFDVFSQSPSVSGLGVFDGLISDAAIGEIWRRLADKHHKKPPNQHYLTSVIMTEAQRNRFHPVLSWLEGLSWDCVPRLDTWLTDYLGSEDTDLNRTIGRIVLVAAVRRVRQPGCKFDHVMVLEGPSGRGKSSAVRLLAHRREWFSDSFPPFDSEQKQVEALLGKWIIEYPELAGLHRSERERVKAFLSRQTDRARPAYGHLPVELQRQGIFIGTTEPGEWLVEANRRFWPVAVDKIDLEALDRDVLQLWAEAAALEAADEPISLPSSLWESVTEKQKEKETKPVWYDAVNNKIGHIEEGVVTTKHMWEILKVEEKDQPSRCLQLGNAMKHLGFACVRIWSDCHVERRGHRAYVKNPREVPIWDLPTIRLWDGD